MDPSILFERLQAIEKRLDALERLTLPMQPFGPIKSPSPFTGCPVCGIGANGEALGYVCARGDCPTRVTC